MLVDDDDDDMWSQSASDKQLVDVMRSHEFNQHQEDPSWPSDSQLLAHVHNMERGTHVCYHTKQVITNSDGGLCRPS